MLGAGAYMIREDSWWLCVYWARRFRMVGSFLGFGVLDDTENLMKVVKFYAYMGRLLVSTLLRVSTKG